jgi:hypothetical protein
LDANFHGLILAGPLVLWLFSAWVHHVEKRSAARGLSMLLRTAGLAQPPGCRGWRWHAVARQVTISGVMLVAACACRVTAMCVPASHPRLWPGRSAAVGKLGG